MSEAYPRTIEPKVSNLLACQSDNPIAGDTMSAVPANPAQLRQARRAKIRYAPWRKLAPPTARRSAASRREAADEGQALRTLSVHAARPRRPLRPRRRAARLRKMRPAAGGEHRALSTQGPQEDTMRNSNRHPCNGAAKRCPVCGGKFGLIRHYCCRTALCSRKCADRFRARLDGDRRWMRLLHTAG